MKRIVKIEGVGNVVFPDSMNDAQVSQAAGRLYDDANPLANAPQLKRPDASPATAGSDEEDTSDWRRIQTSDGKQYKIHPEDLPEAQRRDPNLIIHDQQ
jgi:hypothetical protein